MNRVIGATNLPFNNKETKLVNIKPKFTATQYNDYLKKKSDTVCHREFVKWEKCTHIPEHSHFTIDEDVLNNVIDSYNPNNQAHKNIMDSFRKAYKNEQFARFVKLCFGEIFKNPKATIPYFRRANLNLKPKKEDKTNPDCFRPLIGLDLISKIISKNICVRIDEDCEKYGLINRDIQAAFKGKMEQNCHFINSVFKRRLDLKLDDWVVFFFDLTNAYGTVNFGLLNKILKQKGFSKEICDYICAYYSGCNYTYLGQTFDWQNGIYQGDPLSRIVFCIYIDYVLGVIFQKIEQQKLIDSMDISRMTKAFVDDIAMCIPRKNLDKVLAIIFGTCAEFGLSMNASKTFFISTNPAEKEMQIGDQIYKKADKDFLYLGLPTLCGALEYLEKISAEIYESLKIIDEGELTGEQKMYVWYHKIFMAFKRKIDLAFFSTADAPYYLRINDIFGLFVEFGAKWGADISRQKLWTFALINRGTLVKQLTPTKYHKNLFWDVCPNAQSILQLDEDWSDDIYQKLTGFDVPKNCEEAYEKFVAKTHGVPVKKTKKVIEKMHFMRDGYIQNNKGEKSVVKHQQKKKPMTDAELQQWVLTKTGGVSPESEEGVKVLNEIFTDINKKKKIAKQSSKWFWIFLGMGLLYWVANRVLGANNWAI